MLIHNAEYADLGGDYYARHDPEWAMRPSRPATPSFTVRFDPIEAA
ncbi:hypothetical protein ABTY98_35690 [Streptomyces sp. NPDC096040]